jgi:hypothetical protein
MTKTRLLSSRWQPLGRKRSHCASATPTILNKSANSESRRWSASGASGYRVPGAAPGCSRLAVSQSASSFSWRFYRLAIDTPPPSQWQLPKLTHRPSRRRSPIVDGNPWSGHTPGVGRPYKQSEGPPDATLRESERIVGQQRPKTCRPTTRPLLQWKAHLRSAPRHPRPRLRNRRLRPPVPHHLQPAATPQGKSSALSANGITTAITRS